MRRFLSFALGCFACLCLLIATEQRAHAMYVDPGSGLLVIQSIASAMAAAAFFLRRKIRGLFGGRPKEEAGPAFVPEKKPEASKAA